MRVAFTSSDGKRVDEHFGQATHFHVWEVGPHSADFVEMVGAFGGAGRTHGHPVDHVVGLGAAASTDEEDRIRARADAVEGCTLVYTEAIGGPAAAKLVARRIHPLKTGGEAPRLAQPRRWASRPSRRRPPRKRTSERSGTGTGRGTCAG